jgi:hypothetical protein
VIEASDAYREAVRRNSGSLSPDWIKVGGKVVQDGEAKCPKSVSVRMVAVGSGEENVPSYLMVGCSTPEYPRLNIYTYMGVQMQKFRGAAIRSKST